jgi:cytochrome c
MNYYPRFGAFSPAVLQAALLAFAMAASAAYADETAFNNNCRTCHSIKEHDNRLGPSLHNIVGRKAGTAPEYSAYSQSLRNSGVTWDEATLDKFIENPEAVISNNNMKPFKGVPDKAVRAKIIDFLKSGR